MYVCKQLIDLFVDSLFRSIGSRRRGSPTSTTSWMPRRRPSSASWRSPRLPPNHTNSHNDSHDIMNNTNDRNNKHNHTDKHATNDNDNTTHTNDTNKAASRTPPRMVSAKFVV